MAHSLKMACKLKMPQMSNYAHKLRDLHKTNDFIGMRLKKYITDVLFLEFNCVDSFEMSKVSSGHSTHHQGKDNLTN
jgi:hypothetical protein